MKELVNVINYLTNYTQALSSGVQKFSQALPIFTRQHMSQLTKRKLDSSREAYMEALKIKQIDHILLVELDRENWLANAVESGASAFNLKEGHLNSPKAKISKKGYRYMRIPMGKDPNRPEDRGTDKAQDFQKKINQVLLKPKYGPKKLKSAPNGALYETQKVLTVDPMLQGFYRTRQHDSADDYYEGRKRPKWEYVLFRTMSENPQSKAKWDHPGIQPVHIFRETERWLHEAVGQLLTDFIQSEVESMHQRMRE